MGRATRLAGRLVVWLRWLIPPAWVAGAVAAVVYLPGLGELPVAGVDALIPEGSDAVAAERRAVEEFGVPLLSRIAVVQRDPDGLTREEQERIVAHAVAVDRGEVAGYPEGTVAVPVTNVAALPGSRERSTTAITYLFFPPDTDTREQNALAERYAASVSLPQAPADVTGAIPARLEQTDTIMAWLPWVTGATLALIAVILALYFRAPGAPIVTLAAAGLAYVVSLHVVTWTGQRLRMEVPQEVEPLIVVLLLGVVTDYSVFFLAGMRRRLAGGDPRRRSAVESATLYLPIILTAGLLVAGGVATLTVADIGFVRALGPAMAISVLVGVAVSVTFVPAVLGIFGRALFWPGLRRGRSEREPRFGPSVWAARLAARRWTAALTLAVVVAALGVAATGLTDTRLALSEIRGLERPVGERQAAAQASQGFAPGVIAPTEVDVYGAGVSDRTEAVERFAEGLRASDGVAAVVGASEVPAGLEDVGIFRAPDGDAVRYLVVLEHHPYNAEAIEVVDGLEQALPGLLERAGLEGATAAVAGDTAIAGDTVDRIYRDLALIAAAALAVNVVLLALFLRSLVAPVLLVGASALGLAAAFGITTFVFQGLLGYGELTYYVPLAVGVLLLAFGSDYNVFVVGRIWQEATRMPLRQAIATAAPRASRAIAVAGIALAGSFAALAIIPLYPFRVFAFAMAVGVLVDTFLVRSLLIPSLLSLAGRTSWWPNRPPREERPVPAADEDAALGRAAA